jgi:transposase
MTLSDVAELTLLSWDTVKAIVKTYLAKDYGKPFLKGVRYLGIDEIHVGKKGRFYTIVIDLEDGRILWAKPGRGGAALRGFWPRLRRAKAKIKAVATDMSAAYWSAVLEHLPDAALVFDKFHIIKLMNERLDERNANRAASIWWGLRSTWASAREAANFSMLSDEHRLVSS